MGGTLYSSICFVASTKCLQAGQRQTSSAESFSGVLNWVRQSAIETVLSALIVSSFPLCAIWRSQNSCTFSFTSKKITSIAKILWIPFSWSSSSLSTSAADSQAETPLLPYPVPFLLYFRKSLYCPSEVVLGMLCSNKLLFAAIGCPNYYSNSLKVPVPGSGQFSQSLYLQRRQ